MAAISGWNQRFPQRLWRLGNPFFDELPHRSIGSPDRDTSSPLKLMMGAYMVSIPVLYDAQQLVH